ncbi:flagellar hook-associated protein FlgL [Paenibacillus xerothermodurans]|uniref:Flagellar hook-associated protein FlgL n=1 Tax=Paenibacillus xerothermodurans TaxID=1977292 RepID=A0A2W1N8D1_PAEXE|nr:flagellar hook-associated protein FlgL [Paenibacillus xerothermodurans]PZE19431.1 flagellar hook-associated protein FlgL [Paenibacillus xerothermodurans]
MRVTQGMLNNQLLRNMNSNLTRMQNGQNQLSTGRRINAPSDDPVGMSFSLRYRSELSANEQFDSNLDSAISLMDYTDTMMGQANSVIQRARELAVQGANGTNPQEARETIKSEIDQLYSQMVSIANSQFNGRYIFNGQITDKKPYDEATAQFDKVDSGDVVFDIGVGVRMSVNKTGDDVFGTADDPNSPGTNDNIFRVLKDLSAALLPTGTSTDVSNILGRLDACNDRFLAARADVGAKMNRLELAESRLADLGTNLQTLQSKTEDADIAEVITNLKMDENVYQASLSVGAKLISASLIDFLR